VRGGRRSVRFSDGPREFMARRRRTTTARRGWRAARGGWPRPSLAGSARLGRARSRQGDLPASYLITEGDHRGWQLVIIDDVVTGFVPIRHPYMTWYWLQIKETCRKLVESNQPP
jgi:hypothetical protein